MSEDQLVKLQVMRDVNSITRKRIFAHHPDCDQYNHHIFKLGEWAFCVGDTGMYSALLMSLIINERFSYLSSFPSGMLFLLGTVFFIPAIIQLRWKSRKKLVKFAMRVSLGVSAFYYIIFCFSKANWLFRIGMLAIFATGVITYNYLHKPNSLPECRNCVYGENYHSCLIKVAKILDVKNIELIRTDFPEIDYFLKVKEQRQNKD